MNILDLPEADKKARLERMGMTENEFRELIGKSDNEFDEMNKRRDAAIKAGEKIEDNPKFSDELSISKPS